MKIVKVPTILKSYETNIFHLNSMTMATSFNKVVRYSGYKGGAFFITLKINMSRHEICTFHPDFSGGVGLPKIHPCLLRPFRVEKRRFDYALKATQKQFGA